MGKNKKHTEYYCDTLQDIQAFGDVSELPNEDQVNDYMALLLNILQQCHWFIKREDDRND